MPMPEPRPGGSVTLPTGEVFSWEDTAEVAALAERAAEIERNVRDVKRQAQDALRDVLAAQGRTTLHAGDYEVEETAGRVTYDADALYAALADAGLPVAVLEELFGRTVRDARQLAKLEHRHDAYARAIEATRTRARGRIVVHRRPGAIPAPIAPAAVQAHARELTAAERDAEERGL